MSVLLQFDKLNNIRDLGGMKTVDGLQIRPDKLIRCGNMHELSVSDEKRIGEMLSMIVDLRTDGERIEKPDVQIGGVEYKHIPIMDSLTSGITREAEADRDVFSRLMLKPQEAKAYMCAMYRSFAESDLAISRYATFVGILLEEHDKAILWHCTAGKDRAGIAALIVEELLGVSREDIIEDYLATNRYLENDIAFLTDFVKKQAGTNSPLADESLRYLFGADRDYIETYYDAINAKFNDFALFIRKGLKINELSRKNLRDRYLSQ